MVGEVRICNAGQAFDPDRAAEYSVFDAFPNFAEGFPAAPDYSLLAGCHLHQLLQEVAA